MKRAEAERLLLKSGWLAERPPEMRAEVLARCRLLLPQPGTFLRFAGDDQGGIFGVASGGIGIQVPQGGEGQVLVHIARRGTWIGYTRVGTSAAWPMSYLVMEPSTVLHLPLPQLRELQASRPWMQPHLHALTDCGLERAIANVTSLMIRNPARRIAASLLRISPDGGDGLPVTITLSQEQLGEIANAARDVVNRALKQFEANGWVTVGYRSVTLHRSRELEHFVQSGM
jgi:CRP-like cAMP-binding protein